MAEQVKSFQEPTREEITACAQRIYETEGRPTGKALEHWLQAEKQLRAERKAAQAGAPQTKAAKAAPSQRNSKGRNADWATQSAPRQSATHN